MTYVILKNFHEYREKKKAVQKIYIMGVKTLEREVSKEYVIKKFKTEIAMKRIKYMMYYTKNPPIYYMVSW